MTMDPSERAAAQLLGALFGGVEVVGGPEDGRTFPAAPPLVAPNPAAELVAALPSMADRPPALVAPRYCLDSWCGGRCGLSADEHYEAFGARSVIGGELDLAAPAPPRLVAPSVMNDLGELCCGGFVAPDGAPEYCMGCNGPLNPRPGYDRSDVAAGVAIERIEQSRISTGVDLANVQPLDPGAVPPAELIVAATEQAAGGFLCGPVAPTAGDLAVVAEFREQLAAVYVKDHPAPALSSPAAPPGVDPLAFELQQAVRAYAKNDPRNMQLVAGPSDLGHPCGAFVTRKKLGLPPGADDNADPWASLVGKWVHAGLAEVLALENTRLGFERYRIEQRVHPTDGLSGSCDLLRLSDPGGAEVGAIPVDHKIVGVESMRSLRSAGWKHKGGQYSVQLDVYGLGWERAGVPVTEVALAAWPRSGFLDGLLLLRRPYNREAAEQAIERASNLSATALELGADTSDDPWPTIGTVPGSHCGFCPWRDDEVDEEVPTRLGCGAWRKHSKARSPRNQGRGRS